MTRGWRNDWQEINSSKERNECKEKEDLLLQHTGVLFSKGSSSRSSIREHQGPATLQKELYVSTRTNGVTKWRSLRYTIWPSLEWYLCYTIVKHKQITVSFMFEPSFVKNTCTLLDSWTVVLLNHSLVAATATCYLKIAGIWPLDWWSI